MNAGIADAMNLSWMLAGVINGWADAAILNAYEIERRPITDQVSRYAMNTSLSRTAQQLAIPDSIEQRGPEGDAVRACVGSQYYEINVGQFCCGGLNFGYFYADSPIIAYDGEAAPAYTMYDFRQSTVPGCRTPHLWLRDGRSLYDALGSDFALLKLDPTDAMPFVAEFLQSPDEAVQEGAVLALGESRRPEAFQLLKDFWDSQIGSELRETILVAMALLRLPAANDFLLSLVADQSTAVATAAVSALAVHRHDTRLRERVEAAVTQTGDADLRAHFEKRFRIGE